MDERISVRVPATSANLGCAFDCAALALNLYLDIHLTPRADRAVTIRYTGVTPERISTDSTNLIARTIWDTLEAWKKPRGFDLEIENQIPVAAGLGSSAAAIVGALAACHWLAERPLSDEELLTLATRLEGHPDNAAAAWHGGFTVALEEGGRILATSCWWSPTTRSPRRKRARCCPPSIPGRTPCTICSARWPWRRSSFPPSRSFAAPSLTTTGTSLIAPPWFRASPKCFTTRIRTCWAFA